LKSSLFKIFQVIALFLLFGIVLNAQINKAGFKNYEDEYRFMIRFNKADGFLFEDNYNEAIPLLEELYLEYPNNANVNFLLGHAYLKIATLKNLAIPLLKYASDSISLEYREGEYSERKAPPIVMIYLGDAYHMSYKFDEALSVYQDFLDKKYTSDTSDIKVVTRKVEMCFNALELLSDTAQIEIHNLGNKVNSKYPDYSPVVSADEQTLIFTSRRPDGPNKRKSRDGLYFEDIFVSHKTKGEWGDAERIPEINSKNHEATIGLSADGNTLLIYRDEGKDGNVYLSERKDGKWSEPDLLGSDINTSAWETSASINRDGDAIFFTSNREGGFGGRDIYICKKLPTGDWSLAMNMGPTINTEYDEEAPFIHPDNKTLFFSSNGHNSIGGFDVFYSELFERDWSKPVNLGMFINTTGDDVFYIPSIDRKHAYYSSFKDEGYGEKDIYLLEFPDVKKVNFGVLRGIVVNEDGEVPENIRLTTMDPATGEVVGFYKPNKFTGKFLLILETEKPHDIIIEADDAVSFEGKITIESDTLARSVSGVLLEPEDEKAFQSKIRYDTVYQESYTTIVLRNILPDNVFEIDNGFFIENSMELNDSGRLMIAYYANQIKASEYSLILAKYALQPPRGIEDEMEFLRKTVSVTNLLVKELGVPKDKFTFKDTRYNLGEKYFDITPSALTDVEQTNVTLSNFENIASNQQKVTENLEKSREYIPFTKSEEPGHDTLLIAESDSIKIEPEIAEEFEAINEMADAPAPEQKVEAELQKDTVIQKETVEIAIEQPVVKEPAKEVQPEIVVEQVVDSVTETVIAEGFEAINEMADAPAPEQKVEVQKEVVIEIVKAVSDNKVLTNPNSPEVFEESVHVIDLREEPLEFIFPEGYPYKELAYINAFYDGYKDLYAEIHFDTDKSIIKSLEKEKLDTLLYLYEMNPEMHFIITGHTDSVASKIYNYVLSQQRSFSTFYDLKDMGVPLDHFTLIFFGETNPVADNTEESGRKQNRRAEIYIYGLDQKQIEFAEKNNLQEFLLK